MTYREADAVLFRHVHMIRDVDPKTWGLALKTERHNRGRRKQAKAQRRIARRVTAFVRKFNPAETDLRAKEADRIFQAFMARSLETS